MKILLDINVVLDVVFQRPGEPASSALIATCGQRNQGFLAWHSVATLAYLIERQKDAATARGVIIDLLGWAQVATTGHADALHALQWPMRDFEDALQVAAARACGASVIVTRNERDFVGAPIVALSPEAFLKRYPDRPETRKSRAR